MVANINEGAHSIDFLKNREREQTKSNLENKWKQSTENKKAPSWLYSKLMELLSLTKPLKYPIQL